MYYPFMDYYITELTAILLENGGRYQAQYLIRINLSRLTPETVDVIFDTYKTDLRCGIVMFKAEIKRWKARWATLTTAKPLFYAFKDELIAGTVLSSSDLTKPPLLQ